MSVRRGRPAAPKAVLGATVQARETRELRKPLWKERLDKVALRRLLHDTVQLYDDTRRLRDQKNRIVSLSDAGKEHLIPARPNAYD